MTFFVLHVIRGMIQNNVDFCYNFNTIQLILIKIIWPEIGICSVYSYEKSIKSNISVKIYIQNKMVSVGYPAHVGEDFMTSLKRNVKTDNNMFGSDENKVHRTWYNGDGHECTVVTRPNTIDIHTVRQSG